MKAARPDINTRLTSFAAAELEIRLVRDAVFGDEQKVPRELDWDGKDPACVQVLATAGDGDVIGTGRLQPDGRIGRLAVLKPWRGHGAGVSMLRALIAEARKRGLTEVYLHAQVQAVPFYRRNGFKEAGTEFVEAGIRHINMTMRLQGCTSM
jgi:predicted GNAT family N-acyltransferase